MHTRISTSNNATIAIVILVSGYPLEAQATLMRFTGCEIKAFSMVRD